MITIDLDSPVPLTDQIARALRREIAEGRVVPGDELPTVRQVAGDLGVNFNTVARAYRALEASGLVRTARGRGTRIVASREADSQGALRRAIEALGSALADARLAGLDRSEIEARVQGELQVLWHSDGGREAV